MTQSIKNLISLNKKTALVTGAAQGIGAQIADRLAEAGANIIIFDLDVDKANAQAKTIAEKHGVKAKGYAMNIADFGAIDETIAAALTDFNSIDILVNNAGVYPMMGLRDVKEKEYDFLMNINLKGTFLLSQAVIEKMIAAEKGGTIVNVASTAALKTAGNSAHYVASKHALAGFTKAQAVELGQFGIRSLAVAPTLVNTPGTQKLRENPEIDKGLKDFESRLPLGRMAEPDDIAKTVVFAASDMAAYLTGIIIPVDGGETAL